MYKDFKPDFIKPLQSFERDSRGMLRSRGQIAPGLGTMQDDYDALVSSPSIGITIHHMTQVTQAIGEV